MCSSAKMSRHRQNEFSYVPKKILTWMLSREARGGLKATVGKVHSLSSGKGKMYLCAACHAFTPHVNAWKN